MRSVYIVDDDDAVRASVQGLLAEKPEHQIRVYRSGDDFLEAVEPEDGGVLLLDYHMPGANGLDVLRELGDHRVRFAAVMLTGQGDVSVAVQAMKAGAIDFLEKPYDPYHLLRVVEAAFKRFDTDTNQQERLRAATDRIERLSPRERDVLMGLIEGRQNKVIAHELNLSPRTVEIYRANMMEKLGVGSLSEALRVAFAAGLVPMP
tara:strand:- start:122 stop:736 length:615 start_codon:yes stop_codon:yes gene_type:complete